MAKKKAPICTLCETRVTEEEYCSSCESYICDDCNNNDELDADDEHDAGDHYVEEDEDILDEDD